MKKLNYRLTVYRNDIPCVSSLFAFKTFKQAEAFHITSVSRDDLKLQGFNISAVTDFQMKRIANRMSGDYCEQLYWYSLEAIADSVGVLKIEEQ